MELTGKDVGSIVFTILETNDRVNKMDVLPYYDFDVEKAVEYAKMRNPEIEIMCVSAKTGEGIERVADWILSNVEEWNQ